MSIKAEPLAESIGGFIRDEFMIAVGDRAKIMVELHFLAGSTLKSRAGQQGDFFVDPGHIAHGEHNFVPNEAPNCFRALLSLYTSS